MEQQWKEIPGFPGYEVSDVGNVRSWRRQGGLGRARPLDNPRELARGIDRDGYPRVHLQGPNGGRRRLVHRLVLEAFVGPCPAGMEARHVLDNDPGNCGLSNLAWGTKAQNMSDKRVHGTMPNGDTHWMRANPALVNRGGKCPQSKLTPSAVIDALNSAEPSHVVGERHGVSSSTIRKVRNRSNWRHVAATEVV
jgi:hypothetical protein